VSLTVSDGPLSITAEEETALVLLRLREQIADSALWRALVALPLSTWSDVKAKATTDDASRTNALAAIYLDYIDERGYGEAKGIEKPFCIIRAWSDHKSELVATATWDITGLYYWSIEIPIPTAYRNSVNLATIDFWNKVDRIKREFRIAGQSESGNRIYQPEIHMVSMPGEIQEDKNSGRRTRTAEFAIRVMSGGIS
jgi:hypothetical protein